MDQSGLAPAVQRTSASEGAGTAPFTDLGSAAGATARRLRSHEVDDPGAGDTLLVRLPRGLTLSVAANVPRLREVFVLEGAWTADQATYQAGSYVGFPQDQPPGRIEAREDSLAWIVLEPQEAPTRPGGEIQHFPSVTAGSWGYLDLQDNTDRLPVRWERTRGEATWLLRWPAGHTGVPTAADDVALEGLVLSGDVSVAGEQFEARDYLFCPRGQIPPMWQTRGGCVLLLRTVGRIPGA